MWIRCLKCGWSTRAAFDVERGVTCIACGRYSTLDKAAKLGATPQERFRRAFGYARANRIDLASAYSVLLGIIPADKARSIPDRHDYDPSFKDAVKGGFLTAHQASQRGDRVVYASTLALNHGVDMKSAFLIADNRMQLADASAGPADTAAIDRAPSTRKSVVANVLKVAAVAAAVTVALAIALPPKPAPSSSASVDPAATPPGAEPVFETNIEGRVSRVSGPDPKTVLIALCAHQQFAENLTAVSVVDATPASPDERLGLVRDVRDMSARHGVVIHRNQRTGQWFAGDGRNAIEAEAVP